MDSFKLFVLTGVVTMVLIQESVSSVSDSETLKWFCAIKSNGDIAAKSFVLAEAQKSLGIGGQSARQAIIPMRNNNAGDPHTLAKQWQGGSMWWWGWNDIRRMQTFCERTPIPEKPIALKWFCAVKSNGDIAAKSFELAETQKSLGIGGQNARQAIIPMTNNEAGDPHTLAKQWQGGSMWWWGWEDIRRMQAFCERTPVPEPDSETLKWFCAVKSNGDIAAKSFELAEAQESLGIGGHSARQAIIPMTNNEAGDPHTLAKQWQGGSMWWWGWNDIRRMQSFCERAPVPAKWFCAVTIYGDFTAKSYKLAEAQKSLGIGSRNAQQAIIPMTDNKAGDPHTLDKQWQGGSMWWWGWNEIRRMQDFCERTSIP